MRLDISRALRTDGADFSFQESLDLSDVELLPGLYPFRKPVRVSGRVRNASGVVELTVRMEAGYQIPCDRCCREIERVLVSEGSYLCGETQDPDSEKELLPVNGHWIDLKELALGQLLPELPMQHLCGEDCRGLCPVCGKDLNEGACDCRQKSAHPGMEALRGFLDSDK